MVALTGAGISRESGLKTFRDSDGLWEGYSIEEVCTPMALARQPERVFDFYNMRRREVANAQPNAAHLALAELESFCEVVLVTQNIDDLHERAGSTNIIHIHGEIFKARSMDDFECVVPVTGDFQIGDLAPDGCQLRPHICFFHETPYEWERVMEEVESADVFAVIGTSLNVYPAAGLISMTAAEHLYVVDPQPPRIQGWPGQLTVIAEQATTGVPHLVKLLGGV